MTFNITKQGEYMYMNSDDKHYLQGQANLDLLAQRAKAEQDTAHTDKEEDIEQGDK